MNTLALQHLYDKFCTKTIPLCVAVYLFKVIVVSLPV